VRAPITVTVVALVACGPARSTPPREPRPASPTVEPGAAAAQPTRGPAQPDAPPGPPRDPEVITLVVTGDTCLNRNQLPVDPKGAIEGNGVLAWSEMSAGIRDLIDGDLNFTNLETVVTDRNDLSITDKRQKAPYMFRSHPAGVEHLVDVGFNLLSAANNHSYDYDAEGVRESVKHLTALAKRKKVWWTGVGLDRAQAARPAVFRHRGVPIAFSSIGALTNMIRAHQATETKPGSLGIRFPDDWNQVARELGATEARLRLLSIHYGKERRIRVDERQLRDWRWAAKEGKADVIMTHHAHVVRGVELINDRLIFYGLGNFMIRGARDMGKDPRLATWGDYGLLAKVFLARQADGRYAPRAVIAVPIWDMHRKPIPMRSADESRTRIWVLNAMAAALDSEKDGAVGVRFVPRKDGSGLWCASGAGELGGQLGALCKGWKPPGEPPTDVAAIVAKQLGRR
jgi:poly-gamma-glutamate synthesis protein (capsule biosynthesis protein)